MAITGHWGANGTDKWFNTPVSLGVSCPSGQYPNGTISVDISSSANPAKAWQRRDSNTNRAIDFYLCDSAGNNKVWLWRVSGFTSQGSFLYTPTSANISNSGKLLSNTALYVVGVGVNSANDNSYVGTYGYITITINTASTTSYTKIVAGNPIKRSDITQKTSSNVDATYVKYRTQFSEGTQCTASGVNSWLGV